MEYRKEIDGLRAIAVLPVIFFHAGFGLVSGGYVGVDVFFVISGYLITSILREDLAKGTFSLRQFYERRIRRIIPALAFVLILTLPFAIYYMIPDQIKDFSGSLISTALFVSNFYFSADAGYFGANALEKPLLHTWSLSVEEQYYAFFPLFMMLGWRYGEAWIIQRLCLVALISLFIAEISLPLLGPDLSYFLTTGRAWELLLGSLMAFYADDIYRKSGKNLTQIAGLLGLSLMALAIFGFSDKTPSPSVYTLVPTVGAALVLVFARRHTVTGWLLGSFPLVAIGLVSYSAYLWHQPLFSIARILSLYEPDSRLFGILGCVSVALGALTWALIERPFRKKSRFQRKTIFIAGGITGLVVIAIGLAGIFYNPVSHHSLLRNWKKKQMDSYALFIRNPALKEKLSSFGSDTGRRVLVIGDSHSKDMFNSLYLYRNQWAHDYSFRYQGLGLHCFNSSSPKASNDVSCDLSKAAPQLYKETEWLFASARWELDTIEPLADFIDYQRSMGKKVVIAGRTVEFPNSPVLIHQLFWEKGMQVPSNEEVNHLFWQRRTLSIEDMNRKLKQVVEAHGAIFLDKREYACVADKEICFGLDEKGYPLHYDYGHYTTEGDLFFGARILALDWLGKMRVTH